MKIFNSKNSVNTKTKWAWVAMLLMGIISTGIVSCSNDENSDVTPNPGDRQEVETAWLYQFMISSPQGFVHYFQVSEEIPAVSNLEEATEIGFGGRAFAFGNHAYTYNGSAATVTKWDIDRNTLEVTVGGVVSFASVGISGNLGEPAFLSETQSFYQNLAEGVIVEWNPSTMEIKEVYNVPPIPDAGGDVQGFNGAIYPVNGKLFMPLEYTIPGTCCEFFTPNGGGVIVGVFDPATGTLEYVQDKRLINTQNRFMLDDQGNRYTAPVFELSFIDQYFNVDPNTLPGVTKMLKFNDDGTFDPTFAFDYEEALGKTTMLAPASFIFDNKQQVFYFDTTYIWPAAFEDRFNIDLDQLKSVVVDLNTKELSSPETSQFTEITPNPWTIIDGTVYFNGGMDTGNGYASRLLLRNSANNYTVVSEHIGAGDGVTGIRHIDKLRFTD